MKLSSARRSGFPSSEDAEAKLGVPILATVPDMRTVKERRSAGRTRIFNWIAALLLVGAVAAAWMFFAS